MKLLVSLLLIIPAPLYADDKPRNAKTEGGRFQIIQLSQFSRDQFMIDTATGRIWQNVCVKAGKNNECRLTWWAANMVEDISADAKKLQKVLDQSGD